MVCGNEVSTRNAGGRARRNGQAYLARCSGGSRRPATACQKASSGAASHVESCGASCDETAAGLVAQD
jgi:hypothetical protein